MSSRWTADRWIVEGVVRADSPLAMRTGTARLENPLAGTAAERESVEDRWVQEVDVDCDKWPVIAATGLKGAVRSILTTRCPNDERIDRLIGFASRGLGGIEGKVSQAGRAEFRNATCRNFDEKTIGKRGMVRIDRGTGAAADRRLRSQDFVATGTCFDVRIVLDDVTEEDVAFLVAGLRLLDGSALGGATRQGYGRISWCQDAETVRHLDPAAIVAWLTNETAPDWRVRAVALDKERLKHFEHLVETTLPMGPITRVVLKGIAIAFDGFFLVSEAEKSPGDKTDGVADRRPLGTAKGAVRGVPRLPGTGVKGPLRAQAERIWRTLTGDMSDQIDVIDELFGSTERAGVLRISDFVGQPSPIRRHEMVAIDRFTGGAADQQKFSYAVFEAPTLVGDIAIEAGRKPTEEALGLLVLVLRDLAEGDIGFGFGTSKGYGRVASVRVGEVGLLDALCNSELVTASDQRALVTGWVRALRDKARLCEREGWRDHGA